MEADKSTQSDEENDVEGEVGCSVLSSTNAEADKGKDNTTEKVGKGVLGDRVCMPNTVKA